MNKTDFIEFMLASDVLRFGDFVTKSGRQTQYFVNTGNYRTGAQISTLAKYYAELITETVGSDFDAMFGPAYKGIPLVTAVAASLYSNFGIDKPYFFNRKEAKDHGEGGSLVGYKPKDGDKIIIIEDVITAGTAVRETLPILFDAAKVEVNNIFISVNRCEKGLSEKTATQEIFEQYGIKVNSVVNVCDVHNYLLQKAQTELAKKMEDYMEKYCIV
ncbi:MAG: orotate phosphoribosyltransferase [Clostridiales bacterium]|nr:MAG: orotate phosphoribosyltransferase [Clostridiales bacterium]